MNKVLSDIFSLFSFRHLDAIPSNLNFRTYEHFFHLIENLIICDKIVAISGGIERYDLDEFCKAFDGVFEYIEEPVLNSHLYPSKQNYIKQDEDKYNLDIEKRSLLYLKVAREYSLYFAPHPIRHNFIIKFAYELKGNFIAKELINYFDRQIVSEWNGKFFRIDIEIPPIVEHVIYFAKRNRCLISESVNIIRNSKNALLFRKYCSELDNELRECSPRKKIQLCQALFKDLDKLCENWQQDLDNEVKYTRRHIKLSKLPFLGKLFEFFGINELEVKDPMLFLNRPYFLFINDIYRQ